MAVKKKTTAKKKVSSKKKVATKKKAAAAAPKKKAAVSKPKAKPKAAVKKVSSKKKVAKAASAKKAAPTKATPTTAPTKAAPVKKAAKPASSASTKKPSKPAAKAKKSALRDDMSFSGFTPYEEKRGEDYMNDAMIEHFRGLLMSWKRELMDKVDETVHHMQDEAANFPDPNDRASQESEFAMELRTRDRERKLIKKIEESIAALDGEDYGYCTSCGIEIGIRRLEARPTATECIDCKTLNEIKEKQYSS